MRNRCQIASVKPAAAPNRVKTAAVPRFPVHPQPQNSRQDHLDANGHYPCSPRHGPRYGRPIVRGFGHRRCVGKRPRIKWCAISLRCFLVCACEDFFAYEQPSVTIRFVNLIEGERVVNQVGTRNSCFFFHKVSKSMHFKGLGSRPPSLNRRVTRHVETAEKWSGSGGVSPPVLMVIRWRNSWRLPCHKCLHINDLLANRATSTAQGVRVGLLPKSIIRIKLEPINVDVFNGDPDCRIEPIKRSLPLLFVGVPHDRLRFGQFLTCCLVFSHSRPQGTARFFLSVASQGRRSNLLIARPSRAVRRGTSL